MPRPIHFEIIAPDPAALASFYRDVFGWTITKWDGPVDYWPVATGVDAEPGIHGGLTCLDDGPPRTVNSIGVDSIDDMLARVTAAGGAVAMPKTTIPGVGYQAYVTDPPGALMGLHQEDALAR